MADNTRPWSARLSGVAFFAALLAVAALVVAGPGYRLGYVELPRAFDLTKAGLGLSLAGLVVGLIAIVLGRRAKPARWRWGAVVAALLGFALVIQLGGWVVKARSVPPIHDLSTDLDDPPLFVAIAPLRADASNPVAYAGAEAASAQRGAYPDLEPVRIEADAATVLDAAERAALDAGWEIVAIDPGALRLEATDTTFWYGYKDDIVVRIAPADGTTSIMDVRSKSRVGMSDLGTNAKRIRQFIAAVQARIG